MHIYRQFPVPRGFLLRCGSEQVRFCRNATLYVQWKSEWDARRENQEGIKTRSTCLVHTSGKWPPDHPVLMCVYVYIRILHIIHHNLAVPFAFLARVSTFANVRRPQSANLQWHRVPRQGGFKCQRIFYAITFLPDLVPIYCHCHCTKHVEIIIKPREAGQEQWYRWRSCHECNWCIRANPVVRTLSYI